MAAGLSATFLAKAAGLKRMAVERFEAGEDVPAEVHDQLQQALEAVGVQFIVDNRGNPGVKLMPVGQSSSGSHLAGNSTAGSNPPIDEDAT